MSHLLTAKYSVNGVLNQEKLTPFVLSMLYPAFQTRNGFATRAVTLTSNKSVIEPLSLKESMYCGTVVKSEKLQNKYLIS